MGVVEEISSYEGIDSSSRRKESQSSISQNYSEELEGSSDEARTKSTKSSVDKSGRKKGGDGSVSKSKKSPSCKASSVSSKKTVGELRRLMRTLRAVLEYHISRQQPLTFTTICIYERQLLMEYHMMKAKLVHNHLPFTTTIYVYAFLLLHMFSYTINGIYKITSINIYIWCACINVNI